MNTTLTVILTLGGMVVVAEGLNKIHRTARSSMGVRTRYGLVNLLKVLAWYLLVLGGGGAIVAPHVPFGHLWMQSAFAFTVTGFAVLIVRTRIKEG